MSSGSLSEVQGSHPAVPFVCRSHKTLRGILEIIHVYGKKLNFFYLQVKLYSKMKSRSLNRKLLSVQWTKVFHSTEFLLINYLLSILCLHLFNTLTTRFLSFAFSSSSLSTDPDPNLATTRPRLIIYKSLRRSANNL